MKVYLSGPMTGIPDLNRPAFAKAAQDLRDLGVEVVSPHELNQDLGEDDAWEAYMKGDIKEMMDCTSLALLPGWESSRGAHIELSLAHKLGMGVMMLEDVLPKVKGPHDTSAQILARRDAAIWLEAAEVCQDNCMSIGNVAWNNAVDDCVAELRAKADELLKGLEKEHEQPL